MYSVFRKAGGAVGAFVANNDDILGYGEPAVPAEIRVFFGMSIWKVQSAGIALCARRRGSVP